MSYNSLVEMAYASMSKPQAGSLFLRENNAWSEFTPPQILADIKSLAYALRELGVGPAFGVGIIAPSCPQWFIADLAIQTCQGWTVPLFPNLALATFRFECEDSNANILIVKNIPLLDQGLQADLENFKHVIAIENSGASENTLLWNDLLQRGQILCDIDGGVWFSAQVAKIKSNDVATIIYTSGSTGVPKGVEITHRNLLFHCQSAAILYPQIPGVSRFLSVLPVAHVFERMAIYFIISTSCSVYFADDPKNVGVCLNEVHPTIMSMVPRILERVYEKLMNAPAQVHGLRRLLLKFALRYANTHNPSKKHSHLQPIYDRLVYARFRENLGNSLEQVICGSSALNPRVQRFLQNIGLNAYEGYGLTECAPVLAAGCITCNRFGSVGPAFPGVELRIAENGEVQAKTPGLMKGYHNRPEETASCFTQDGWFRTGDRGRIDTDGFLTLTGRIKEMFKTSTGKYVSPAPIEEALCRHPLLEYAVVIAENRKFPMALLFLNHAAAETYLQKQAYDPNRALQSRHIRQRIERQVRRVNQKLNEWEKIRKWVLLIDTPTTESGLLTPTMKIRRHAIDEQYHDLIQKTYEP